MKIIEFLIGLSVLFMGLLPFLARIESIKDNLGFLGEPGGMIYQGVLIVIGVLTILYAIGRKKQFKG